MKIDTKYHGEVQIEETEIIDFASGIPGFLEEKKFVILPFGQDTGISVMQSVGNSQLAFAVTNPFFFNKEYDFTIDDQVVEQLQIDSEEDVTVYVILTVQDPFEKTTANLQAPVVLNNKKQVGKQVILTNTSYQTKHSIFEKVSTK
ncbi:flagellar assembly protein FliW [Bacillus timonensis]|uniref:Flagellar assembly factor FliW n=1 Tax=Bacillus timonensis TaxID=1033734 RepID=A0A4S3PSQ0_9BACI|nr:flagellar assembly protein FliW [Bacillus timonensis]THE12345.1 flagellar assembly protein FliW [Bacillus timonensis]